MMISSKFYSLKPGAPFLLLLSLAAACGSSGEKTDAGSSTAGSKAGTGGSKADAGSSKAGAGGSKADAGSSKAGAGGSKADAGSSKAGAGGSGGSKADAGNGSVATVNLGTAANYVILAKSGISTVPTSAVTGDLGVSPAAASYITGFSLTADSTNKFATSPQVTGKVYAADYAAPTPSNLTTAVGDMELAFSDAAGRAASVTELGAGDIGGMTLAPGVYKWGTGLLIPTDVTLKGSATGVWILQIAQDLNMSSGVKVLLSGGALPKNVFWQVSGKVVLDTTAHCEGVVLAQTAVTLRTGASINGRLLAQTAVNIDSSTVVAP